MRAIVQTAPQGGPEILDLSLSVPDLPEPTGRQMLVRVHASAVNRADLSQRQGTYPPPPGASSILGLECAGVVEKLGPDAVGPFKLGDRVMALLSGGGYADMVLVDERHAMPIPPGLSWTEAAAIPEVWLTAFQLLHMVGRVQPNETVLVHAAASGVGTAAIQLCRHVFHARVLAIVGSDDKKDYVCTLGAQAAFNYKVGAFADFVREQTAGLGCQVVLDPVGGSNWQQNQDSCAMDGRWVLYGSLGGVQIDGPLFGAVMRKRLSLLGTTLRNRDDDYKASLVAAFCAEVLPLFTSRQLQPVIHRVLPMAQAAQAHVLVASNTTVGKVVLSWDD